MIIYKDIGHDPELVLEKMVECVQASIGGLLEEKWAANSAECFA